MDIYTISDFILQFFGKNLIFPCILSAYELLNRMILDRHKRILLSYFSFSILKNEPLPFPINKGLGLGNCMKAVLPNMIEECYGKIVNIAFNAARSPDYGSAFYGGCKAAIMALSKTVALEVGRYKININVVCPSLAFPEDPHKEIGEGSVFRTVFSKNWYPPEKMEKIIRNYPMGRIGRPADIANAVVFLSSNAAEFITGQTLSVNRGYLILT